MELTQVDKFFIDGNPSLSTPELASVLGKPSAQIETYLAVKAQREYLQERTAPKPKSDETKASTPNSSVGSSGEGGASLPNSPAAPTEIPSVGGVSKDVGEGEQLKTKKVSDIEVIKPKKNSPLRDAFARRAGAGFVAMTSSAGMISDEISKEHRGQNLLDREGVTTATGRD